MTHIVLELSGMGGEEGSGLVKERNNEEMTTLVSRGLMALMNLNTDLFKVILNG